MSSSSSWRDCGVRCRSVQHQTELTSALCSGSAELASLVWCQRHCHAPARLRDMSGRSLVHIAAANGQVSVLEWLIRSRDCQLNSKDTESGYTGLHRAMFHGNIRTVVYLIQQGANTALLDHDGLTVLDHAVLDRPLHLSYEATAPLEAYVWGNNSNYNLGLGTNTTRHQPDILESLKRVNITNVCLQKFHSAFISRSGRVMTCGHGGGGRLGHGSETMQLEPRPVTLPSQRTCTDVSLGVDHSLFLCDNGLVYSCGDNSYHQLGHSYTPAKLLSPAPVYLKAGEGRYDAVGVAAGKYHSVFWSEDSLYTWGLNAGHLGHLRGDRTVVSPRLVSSVTSVSLVSVSDAATVVLNKKGEVMALHGYTSKKLGQRQHNIVKMSVTGGHLDPGAGALHDDIDYKLVAGGGSVLRVMLVTVSGKVSVWEDNRENNFISCMFSVSKPEIFVRDLALHRSGLTLVSKAGEAWQGTYQGTTSKNGSKDIIKVKRVANIHRGVSVATDPKGRNHCILQVCPNEALTEIPEISSSTMTAEIRKLHDEVSLYDDLHDVICKVGQKTFPAHSFILSSGSENLAKQLNFLKDELDDDHGKIVIEIKDIHPEIFEQILKFLYTNTCDLLREGSCQVNTNQQVKKDEKIEDCLEVNDEPKNVSAFSVYNSTNNKQRRGKNKKYKEQEMLKGKNQDPLSMFADAAKQLGLTDSKLYKLADSFFYIKGEIRKKVGAPRSSPIRHSYKYDSSLGDVSIVCENEEELFAHKCILVSRSEYFASMFCSGWTESSSRISLPMDPNIVQIVLEYLYSDQSVKVSKCEDAELVCSVLVAADQFLLSRLKEMCECQVSRLISLKNVSELLQFSVFYGSEQLQRSTMQFICLNLPALLETRSLENLDEESFEKLDEFYKRSNPVFRGRKLSPLVDTATSDVIETEYLSNPVTLEELMLSEEMEKMKMKTRRRRRSSSEKSSEGKERERLSSCGSQDLEEEVEENILDIEEKSDTEETTDTSHVKTMVNNADQVDQLHDHKPMQTQGNRSEKKKFARLSQKEKKRLSQEAAVVKDETPSPDKSPWSGWASLSQSSSTTPSLKEILSAEVTPVQEMKTKTRSEKKTSWRKIDLDSSSSVSCDSPSPVKMNPWKLPVQQFAEIDTFREDNIPDDCFKQIMKDDFSKEEELIRVQSKPLQVTQIEEKAIDELKQFYNVDTCQDEIITVDRVKKGTLATPVWKKNRKL